MFGLTEIIKKKKILYVLVRQKVPNDDVGRCTQGRGHVFVWPILVDVHYQSPWSTGLEFDCRSHLSPILLSVSDHRNRTLNVVAVHRSVLIHGQKVNDEALELTEKEISLPLATSVVSAPCETSVHSGSHVCSSSECRKGPFLSKRGNESPGYIRLRWLIKLFRTSFVNCCLCNIDFYLFFR